MDEKQSTTYDVGVRLTLEVTVKDPEVIDQCVGNHDDDGNPVEFGSHKTGGERGWLEVFYPDCDTPERVMEHLLFNHFANRVDTINRLDGWASFPPDVVEFDRVQDVEVWTMDALPNRTASCGATATEGDQTDE